MSTVVVEVVIGGLIALTPLYGSGGPSQGANHIAALVVDGSQNPTDDMCFSEHEPKLSFNTTSAACTEYEECYYGGVEGEERCTCILSAGRKISLLPAIEPPRQVLPGGTPNELPADNAAAGDFRYVANLARLGHQLRDGLLNGGPTAGLQARFDIPFHTLLACNLAAREAGSDFNVHAFEFRPIGSAAGSASLRQAAAQTVVVTTKVSLATGEELTLVVADLDGNNPRLFPLLGSPTRIDLTNHRVDKMRPTDPCNDGIGRDFAFYYDLTEEPPQHLQRPLPHVDPAVWVALSDVDPPACLRFFSPESTPICPVGGFNPGS